MKFKPPETTSVYLSKKLEDSPRKKQLRNKLEETQKQNRNLKRKLCEDAVEMEKMDKELFEVSEDYRQALSALSGVENSYGQLVARMMQIQSQGSDLDSNSKYRKELQALQSEYEDVVSRLNQLESEPDKTKTKPGSPSVKYLNRKIKRKSETIKKQQEAIKNYKGVMQDQSVQIKEIQSDLVTESNKAKTLEGSLNELNKEIKVLKKEKQKLQQKCSYNRKETEKSVNRINSIRDEVEEEKIELDLKRKELEIKEKELKYFEQMLESDTIQTFRDGKYLDHIRLTIMELLSMNVSINKVNDFISVVLKRLANKTVDRLPSKGLRCQLLIEARHLADIQVGQAMLEGTDLSTVLGNTLHGDGTTKYHRHYQNFQVSTPDGQSLTAGLVEIVGQDAETLLNCWQERIREIAQAAEGRNSSPGDVDKTVNNLLVSIKNTMSDQCAVNGAFNNLYSTLREELLPTVIDKWDDFGPSEKKNLLEMGNFFCKVHPLITFAEESNKALLRFESAVMEGESKYALPSSGESGTVRLIRTACQAFQKRGNQQAGQSEDFKSYLGELDYPLKLITMEGQRFNVIFYNGGAVYYHREHVSNFINSKYKNNRLLLAVNEDLSNKVFVAGVRSLGIISKLITGPYFRLVGKLEHMLDLNPYLLQLQQSLQAFSQDAMPLLNGKSAFDENDVEIDRDVVYFELLKYEDDEFQILTQQILELLCSVILIVLEKQCQDQLPGGKYTKLSESLKTQALSVPASNIRSERDYAIFDVLLRSKPFARVASMEALIMWANNKPANWLDSLPDDLAKQYHEDSRKMAYTIQKRIKARRQKIIEDRRERRAKNKGKKEEEERKRKEKKLSLTLEVEKAGGLWKSEREVQNRLRQPGEKEKISMLYNQLQFHHVVLDSSAPETYYFQKTHSSKGRKVEFTAEQMEQHLLEIIMLNMKQVFEIRDVNEIPDPVVENEPVFKVVSQEQRIEIVAKQKETIQDALKDARMKRKSSKSKEWLDKLTNNPELFVGKRIMHKVQEDEEDIPEWYDATVVRIEKDSKDRLRTMFEITYDIDGPDAKFSFALISELKKGNLIITS